MSCHIFLGDSLQPSLLAPGLDTGRDLLRATALHVHNATKCYLSGSIMLLVYLNSSTKMKNFLVIPSDPAGQKRQSNSGRRMNQLALQTWKVKSVKYTPMILTVEAPRAGPKKQQKLQYTILSPIFRCKLAVSFKGPHHLAYQHASEKS